MNADSERSTNLNLIVQGGLLTNNQGLGGW